MKAWAVDVWCVNGSAPSCSHLWTLSLLCCAGSFALCHWTGRDGPLHVNTLIPSLYRPAAVSVPHISPPSASLTVLAAPSCQKKTDSSLKCICRTHLKDKKTHQHKMRSEGIHTFTCILLFHCCFHKRVFSTLDDTWHIDDKTLNSALQNQDGIRSGASVTCLLLVILS